MRSTSIPGLTRIVCPACQAVYEVPAAAIPPGGRDVQCSACAHNWYQLAAANPSPAVAVAVTVPEASVSGAPPELSGSDRLDRLRAALRQPVAPAGGEGGVAAGFGVPEDDADAPAVPGFAERSPMPFRTGGFQGPEAGEGAEPDDEPELDLPPPPRRRIDPQVLDVLRSEAETETLARRRDTAAAVGAPIETQGELPLTPRPRRSAAEVRDRLARLQAAERGGAERWTAAADLPSDPPEAGAAVPGLAAARSFPPLPPLAEARPRPERVLRARPEEMLAPDRAPDRTPDRAAVRGLAGADTPPETRLFQRAAPDSAPDRVSDRLRPRAAATAAHLPVRVAGSRSTALAVRQQAAAARRRGFRIGFAAPVALASAALALYLAAPRLIETLPVAAPALSEVVRQGDAVQANLAARVRDMLLRLAPAGSS